MPNDPGDEPDTRTIAREAVEAEFRKKKRKRGYDSSDDEGGGNKKKEQQQAGVKKSKQQVSSSGTKTKTTRPLAIWEVKYRDRAKERREGKNPVDAEEGVAEEHTTNEAQNLLQDVLEDDENNEKAHDKPMVRGLNRSLIERYEETQQESSSDRFVANRQEALEWLSSATLDDQNCVTSAIGRALLPVLKQHYLPPIPVTEPSRAGLAIQRSTFIMDVRPHLNVTQAWQVPRQEEDARANSSSTAVVPKISPVGDAAILKRMQSVLDRQRLLETQVAVASQAASSFKPVIDSDEDIFAMDDDDHNEEKDTANDESSTRPAKDESPSQPRKTFFFNAPSANDESTHASALATSGQVATTTTVRLERLSQVDRGDEDVDFDGRIEEEQEGKKKRRRKRRDGDDSD